MATIESAHLPELIRQCSAGHGPSWELVWNEIDAVSRTVFMKQLRAWHEDLALVDDLSQDLFLYLSQASAVRLRRFRGTSLFEFRSYIRRIAGRFVRRRLRVARTFRRHAIALIRGIVNEHPSGPSESAVAAAMDELFARLTPSERQRLLTLLATPTSTELSTLSASTRRRWTLALYRRCVACLE